RRRPVQSPSYCILPEKSSGAHARPPLACPLRDDEPGEAQRRTPGLPHRGDGNCTDGSLLTKTWVTNALLSNRSAVPISPPGVRGAAKKTLSLPLPSSG